MQKIRIRQKDLTYYAKQSCITFEHQIRNCLHYCVLTMPKGKPARHSEINQKDISVLIM